MAMNDHKKDCPCLDCMTPRRPGHSRLVYNKATQTIDTVRTNVPDRVMERAFAIKLANKVLENTALDPDGDLSVLARQFLRETERFDYVRAENEEMRRTFGSDPLFAEARRDERERCAMLHESVNPASDRERLDNVPGAGAMGAVIEYRDLIRSRKS